MTSTWSSRIFMEFRYWIPVPPDQGAPGWEERVNPHEFRRKDLDLIDAGRKIAAIARDLKVSNRPFTSGDAGPDRPNGLSPASRVPSVSSSRSARTHQSTQG